MILDYNKMPKAAVRLTDQKLIGEFYQNMQDFFTYCIEAESSRQVFYEKDNLKAGTFNLRIFWTKEKLGLGFGIAQDWKENKIHVYRFGTAENWKKFKVNFAVQMRGDNS